MPKEDQINCNCHGRRSSCGRALRLLYLTCILPDHLCVDGMDGENIPDEDIAAVGAVGAIVIEHCRSTLYPASLWCGLADGVVGCCDCCPMMGCPASFSNFKLGCRRLGWLVFHGSPSHFVFFSCLFAHPIAGHVQ